MDWGTAAVRGLLNVQKEEDPDILFLSETKMDRATIQGFRWKLGLTNMTSKDCDGKSGGLAIFWQSGIDLHVRHISRMYIDAEVKEADGFVWRLTGFYGESATEKVVLSWKALRTLNAMRHHSWLCVGDFNEVLEGEKEGGPKRSQVYMDRFKEALEDYDLNDLGLEGDPFTWRNNSHTNEHYIRERLDKAVACGEWIARFPLYQVINGEPRHSDHRPIIVDIDPPARRGNRGRHQAFCFEASWVEEQCAVIVENAWRTAIEVSGEKVEGALRKVASDLGDWSRDALGDLEERIKHVRKSLEECRRSRINERGVAKEEVLRFKLARLEEQKNIYWRQRAKVHWPQEGDRNTHFFHKYASERRKRSRLNRLVLDDGRIVEREEEMLEQVLNYYKNLFTSNAGN